MTRARQHPCPTCGVTFTDRGEICQVCEPRPDPFADIKARRLAARTCSTPETRAAFARESLPTLDKVEGPAGQEGGTPH